MGKERPNRGELDPQTVASYAQTFISRRDRYAIQLDNGAYVSVSKELTENLIAAHLKGYLTLGAYALNPNGWAKWICFDADDEKRWLGLQRLAKTLQADSIVPYLEPSRRGGHMWLFTPSIPGFQIRRFGKQLLAERKLTKIEIYPKQNKPQTGPGSLVRLPLGIHKLTGKRYHFINLDGTPLAPTIRDQISIFANPQHVPQTFIDDVLQRAPIPKVLSPTPQFRVRGDQDVHGSPSERIKTAISVYDFVSQYVELDPAGKGYCPFHDDQHKSFGVSQDGNYWNCFAGCGGGSIIDFWAKWREKNHQNASFKATIRDLVKMLL
jgi:hypothetical protein